MGLPKIKILSKVYVSTYHTNVTIFWSVQLNPKYLAPLVQNACYQSWVLSSDCSCEAADPSIDIEYLEIMEI